MSLIEMVTCEWRLKVSELVMWISGGRAAYARALRLEPAWHDWEQQGDQWSWMEWVKKSRRLRPERHRSLDCIGLCSSSREFWVFDLGVVFKALRVDEIVKGRVKQLHDSRHRKVGSSTKTCWEMESLDDSNRHFEARDDRT